MFSAINCTLDASNGAAISIRTILRLLSREGVECISLSASVYDRPGHDTPRENLDATGARPVEEPGLPQTLWLGLDEGVRHYIEQSPAMVQKDYSRDDEQKLFNRSLAMLDRFRPDILLVYGSRAYERSLLRQARLRGIKTVFYLVNPGYKKIEHFQHVDLVVTDTEATRALYAERFGIDCLVIGKFIETPPPPANAARQYVTFINPSAEKGVTLFLRIVELAWQVMPDVRFLVVENRASLPDAETRTGLAASRSGMIKRIGMQRDMAAVFDVTRILLVPSLWHDSGPRVLVEAFSQGIPVVASRRGGIPEIVGRGGILLDPPAPLVEHHWLVPPLSHAIPWVEAIRQLLTDDVLYAEYSAAALAEWARHDPAPRMKDIVAELERLVDSPFRAA